MKWRKDLLTRRPVACCAWGCVSLSGSTARLGWLQGSRFLMLTHIGRKSGLARQTNIEVVGHDGLNPIPPSCPDHLVAFTASAASAGTVGRTSWVP